MTELSLSELLDVVGPASGPMRDISASLVVSERVEGYVEPEFRVETEDEPLSSPILLVSAQPLWARVRLPANCLAVLAIRWWI